MRAFRHLRDHELLRVLGELLARERAATAELIACIAEVDARRLYRPAGYPSMHLYCIHELHLSADAAYKRIQAARAARRFPAILGAVADGRLHLTAVVLLIPFLTSRTADELMTAATHKTKAEVQELLARRFPRPDLPARIEALPVPGTRGQLVPEPVGAPMFGHAGCSTPELVPEPVGACPTPELVPEPAGACLTPELVPEPVGARAPGTAEPAIPQAGPECVGVRGSNPDCDSGNSLVPEPVAPSAPWPRVAPLAPDRYAVQVTIGKGTHDKLLHVQSLLSHRVPSGDLAAVLDMVLDLAIGQLEKRKFAATETPRPRRRRTRSNPRHIPAHVKRTVWERDGGRCTFVSDKGHRCTATRLLEYDHVEPVARGGDSTAANLRLRCRAHNQHEAERVFGAGFMEAKRESARRARGALRPCAAAP